MREDRDEAKNATRPCLKRLRKVNVAESGLVCKSVVIFGVEAAIWCRKGNQVDQTIL